MTAADSSRRGGRADVPGRAGTVRAIAFDLDGTLVDTAGEIAVALNRTLAERGLAALSKASVETLIGRGVPSMVERALRLAGAGAVDAPAAVERFEAHYAATVATAAELYPGVREGLELLGAARVPMAVVTNKPRGFSERLLDRLEVRGAFAALVAGDDGYRRKPDGAMLVAACERMTSRAADTVMVGDSDNDVRAARHAGCRIWCVPYGYNEGRAVETLACDRVVDSVLEAARLVVAPE